jgi:hypothetical protein
MTFSERIGKKQARTVIQIGSMDAILRTAIWNALLQIFFNQVQPSISGIYGAQPISGSWDERWFDEFWRDFLKKPLDEMPWDYREYFPIIRQLFFKCEWHEVYDIVEFIIQHSHRVDGQQIETVINSVLKKEISGYRVVNGHVIETTSEAELATMAQAASATATSQLQPVNQHLETALVLLSDRKNPDYRNSIKESISAVESVCKIIAETPNTTLDRALDKLAVPSGLHPALRKAFSALYGWTSDSEGIRHALMDLPTIDFADAKYMYVSCSAFVVYLIDKCCVK